MILRLMGRRIRIMIAILRNDIVMTGDYLM